MMSTQAVTDYDPFTPEFQADPFSVYRWMHQEAPVYYSPRWNWWALSKWEDVRAAALDSDTFLSFEGIDIDATATEQSGPGFLADVDNPRHDQIRRIVQPWFLPRRIGGHEDHIRNVVRSMTQGWDRRGSIDLAGELAWPLPIDVFFGLLGLPEVDSAEREQLERWTHELKDREPGSDRLTPRATAATAGIREYFAILLNERRSRPRQDLVTHIVQSTIDGIPFADEHITPASEVMGLMMVLFLGGVETTAGLTSTFFKLLAENPDQRALLRQDPSLIPTAVEETVRFATPLQLVGRTTSRDVTIRGVTIPKGGRVVLVYGAANRDPDQFADPEAFDVTRPRLRHLGFGEGMHGCLGAPLARLEVRIAAEELLPVLGDYELSGPAVRYQSTPNAYVWKNLHISPKPIQRRPTKDGDENK
jgi:cytochrome P450